MGAIVYWQRVSVGEERKFWRLMEMGVAQERECGKMPLNQTVTIAKIKNTIIF